MLDVFWYVNSLFVSSFIVLTMYTRDLIISYHTNVIILFSKCGHGGGRSSTFQWFEDHKIEVYGYGREPFELTPEEKWTEVKL